MTGLAVIVVAVAIALAFGGWRAYADGRFRGTRAVAAASVGPDASAASVGPGASVESAGPGDAGPPPTSVLAGTPYAGALGERATLLQFSSAFCAPCRVTRRTLADVATLVPGVAHVEVDAEHHLDLVRRIGVLRTPTTLVLDAAGHEVSRAAGAPTKPAVLASLDFLT